MSTDSPLASRAAFVTGAGSGLGEATARALAAAGAAVACIDRDSSAAARVADDLAKSGATAMWAECDVSDPAQVADGVQRACDRLGHLDIAVNCAAVDYVTSMDDMSLEQWNRVLAVNLTGPFLVAKAVYPIMRARGGGHIVNIASTAALRAWGNASAYHATKWGLRGFSRALGAEGRADNIHVTCMIPGGMRTHWFDTFPEQGIPLPDERHLQDPATVARAIVFAVSLPPESALQEMLLTSLTETSWP